MEDCGKGPRIAIVGAGPRGLSVLERIVAVAHARTVHPSLTVHLVGPATEDSGPYAADQPDYILLNIVCGQVSMYPHESCLQSGPPTAGPTLLEWASAHDLRLAEDGYTVGRDGRALDAGDFLPRRLLGEYLRDFRDSVVAGAPSEVDIQQHRCLVQDIRKVDDSFLVDLADGAQIMCEYVFLTLGDALPDVAAPTVPGRTPYPLPSSVDDLPAGSTVGVAGLGLTAVDVVMALTVGRGGRFTNVDGNHTYVPSGAEPHIVLFSRSGLPYRSRPDIRRVSKPYSPVAFTFHGIDRLRLIERELDFDTHVLPLLLLEMRIAYMELAIRIVAGSGRALQFRSELGRSMSRDDLELVLRGYEEEFPVFDEAAYFGQLGNELLDPVPSVHDPRPRFDDARSYRCAVITWLRTDLVEANKGLDTSPLKVALELCRELRDVVRYAVDFSGLTAVSEDRFHRYHRHLFDRAVVGPQRDRTADLLALLDAGVVDLPAGPDPSVISIDGGWQLSSRGLLRPIQVRLDALVGGYVPAPSADDAQTQLVQRMLASQLLRRHSREGMPPRGIEIDGANHPVAADTESNMWVFGMLCEGPTYYNNYIPSPGGFVRSFADADRAVGIMVEEICATSSRSHRPNPVQSDHAEVVAVAASPARGLAKDTRRRIRLILGVGVEGDVHAGPTAQHLARKVKDPFQENLRQVHLIGEELFTELSRIGMDVRPGDMGENITTRGLDLHALPRGTELVFPSGAVVRVTGLRNPCRLLDRIDHNLYPAVRITTTAGTVERRSGVMGVVTTGGMVTIGDRMLVRLPAGLHQQLDPV